MRKATFIATMLGLSTLLATSCGQETGDPYEGIAAYDESIATTASDTFYIPFDDFRTMADESDVVVVAKLIGYAEATVTEGPDEEDPERLQLVLDSYVFTVTEVLKGSLEVGDHFHVLTPGLLLNEDGSVRFRVPDEVLADLLEAGMIRRSSDASLDYVIYGISHTPADDHIYNLNTPAGIAQVLPNEKMGLGIFAPMAGPDRERLGGNNLTLADLRAAAEDG